jgi:hypothetical protein
MRVDEEEAKEKLEIGLWGILEVSLRLLSALIIKSFDLSLCGLKSILK